MKLNQNLILFLGLMICTTSCNFKNKRLEHVEKREAADLYSPIRVDTIKYYEEINIENNIHQLELKLYSLNDSSVVFKIKNIKEVDHNWESEIILRKKNDTILHKQLAKEIFKDSIDSEIFKTLIIGGIGYKSIRSNRLFFNIQLYDPFLPRAFSTIETELGVFFRTEKKGKLNFNKFQYAYR